MKKIIQKIIILALIIFSMNIQAQFNATEFNFVGNARVLDLNPGANYQYSSLFGVPMLNNTQLFAGNTGFTLYDIFSPQGNFNDKVFNTIDQLKNTDFMLFHYRQDLFSYGFTDDMERFKYFGLYWEFDHISYFPADIIRLGVDGNSSHMFETYELDNLASKTEFVQTMYYGINKKISRQLSIGYRFKLYSGIVNAQSTGNSGKYYTTEGSRNYYIHHFDDINLSSQTSGYNKEATSNYYLRKLLFSQNYGPGVDFGFNYEYDDNWSFSGSLLDLGFIYYTKDINSNQAKGDYIFEGASLEFPETGFIDYWKYIKVDFQNKTNTYKNHNNYFSFRSTTLYASMKYGMGNLKNQSCEDFLNLRTEHTSFFGLTGFAQYRPVKIHIGISAFYEQKWSKYFYTKLNYSIDNFSYTDISAAMALNIGRLQLYLSADNFIGLSDLSKSHKQSISFGLNVIKW